MTNFLAIAFVSLQLTEVKIQMESEPGYAWVTNAGGSISIPGGVPIRHEAHVGKTIKLNWQPSTNLVLQSSSDLVNWDDIRVDFQNSSGWMASPVETRFYRLRQK